MKKEDIQLWLNYIELNTDLMRNCIELALREEKINKLDAATLKWHLNRINHASNRIKELVD